MNESYDGEVQEPDTDPRIIAVHQVVDLERQYESAVREVERRQKQAAIAQEELRQARDDLSGLLGYPSSNTKAMSKDEVKQALAERYAQAEQDARGLQ